MGRKADLARGGGGGRSGFALAVTAQPVTAQRLLAFLLIGASAGLALGFCFMGTVHAFLEIGASTHHGQQQPIVAKSAADAQQQQQQLEEQPQRQRAGRKELPGGGGGGAAAGGESWPTKGDTVHIAYTSNGSPYQNWQNLVLYGTFLLAQQQPGGDKMVGFTRILHRATDDALSKFVPTFRANPLTPECDVWCDYPVADRPNAVRQFLDAARTDPGLIKAPWLYMIETDFVFVKPIMAPPAESGAPSAGFPYGYIQPTYPTIEGVMRKLYPSSNGPLSGIPNTGPSPLLMRVADWQRVTPLWESLTAQVQSDEEAKKALDWVREMYAFSVALALEKVKVNLPLPPESTTMVQPPADHRLGKAHCMHYTWGATFVGAGGAKVWEWDKRYYSEQRHEDELPKIPLPPPFEPGWKLQDGVAVTKDLYDILVLMLTTMNAGIDVVKNEKGWGRQ